MCVIEEITVACRDSHMCRIVLYRSVSSITKHRIKYQSVGCGVYLQRYWRSSQVNMNDTYGAAPKPVLFLDIDNTLYPKSKKVQNMMGDLIDKYFMTHLSLTQEEAYELHQKYYKEYGLAIEGLVRYHKVDPLEYNTKVDDALPLENVIIPDPQLRKLLEDIDTNKVRLWLFTNAYVTHGKRVVKLLEVEDLFEGITYCDYGAKTFVCKPHKDMFAKAQREAGVPDPKQCYFVDDSALNCSAAQALGWTAVHLVEPDDMPPLKPASKHQIRDLEQLRTIFPQFFKNR